MVQPPPVWRQREKAQAGPRRHLTGRVPIYRADRRPRATWRWGGRGASDRSGIEGRVYSWCPCHILEGMAYLSLDPSLGARGLGCHQRGASPLVVKTGRGARAAANPLRSGRSQVLTILQDLCTPVNCVWVLGRHLGPRNDRSVKRRAS